MNFLPRRSSSAGMNLPSFHFETFFTSISYTLFKMKTTDFQISSTSPHNQLFLKNIFSKTSLGITFA
jgi:hypothetical protein